MRVIIMSQNLNNNKATTMKMNTLSISIITALVSWAIAFGGFMYKTGSWNTELTNVKTQSIVQKEDFNKQLDRMENKKADKSIVDMIFLKMNSIEHKLDRIIEDKGE